MNRWIPLAFASFALAVFATPTARAVERYDDALGQLVGATKGMAGATDLCGDAYPELKPRLTTALIAWQQRNERTLAEIDLRWNRLRQEISGGDSEREAEVIRQLEVQTRRAEQAARAQITRLPAERVRILCTGLPELLASPDRDLEVLMKSQLESIRELRPSP